MAARKVLKLEERQEGKWWYQRWNDGTEQWSVMRGAKTDDIAGSYGLYGQAPYKLKVATPAFQRVCFYIERVQVVKGRISKRKNWCIVNRCTNTESAYPGVYETDTTKYPPSVAGPFEDLAGAKAALMIILSNQGENS